MDDYNANALKPLSKNPTAVLSSRLDGGLGPNQALQQSGAARMFLWDHVPSTAPAAELRGCDRLPLIFPYKIPPQFGLPTTYADQKKFLRCLATKLDPLGACQLGDMVKKSSEQELLEIQQIGPDGSCRE